jgi:hypothetical protein
MIGQLIVALIVAYVAYKLATWLVAWAKRALQGFVQGMLTLVREEASVNAYALGRDYGELAVVDEIEVDEKDLDEDILEALERHGRLIQKVQL